MAIRALHLTFWIFVFLALLVITACAGTPSSQSSCPVNPKTVTATQTQAEAGEPASQYQVGLWYQIGGCLKPDRTKATEWFRRAAEQGHADAQFELGRMYYHGYGIEKDEEETARWYEKAAEQGHSSAARKLGDLYASGSGVAKDADRAEYWYRRAYDGGDAASKTTLDYLLANLEKIRNPGAWERKQQRLAEERKQEQQRLAEERKQEQQRLNEEKQKEEKRKRTVIAERLGTLAITVPRMMDTNTEANAIEGIGVIGSAALGFLYTWDVVGLLTGALAGAEEAAALERIKQAARTLAEFIQYIDPASDLRDGVAKAADQQFQNEILSVERDDPAAPLDYEALSAWGADTVIDLTGLSVQLVSDTDQTRARLDLAARYRIVDTTDEPLIAEQTIQYAGSYRPLIYWAKDHVRPLRAELERGYNHLATQIFAMLMTAAESRVGPVGESRVRSDNGPATGVGGQRVVDRVRKDNDLATAVAAAASSGQLSLVVLSPNNEFPERGNALVDDWALDMSMYAPAVRQAVADNPTLTVVGTYSPIMAYEFGAPVLADDPALKGALWTKQKGLDALNRSSVRDWVKQSGADAAVIYGIYQDRSNPGTSVNAKLRLYIFDAHTGNISEHKRTVDYSRNAMTLNKVPSELGRAFVALTQKAMREFQPSN